MELRHLRVFITLAEELHFGRTSSRLHVAQSAISHTVRDLESELDARLFSRTSRHVKLTEAGLELLAYAREAVQVIDRGVRATRASHSDAQRLRIRMLSEATLTELPSILARFQREHPQTVLEVRDGTSARNLAALEDAFCDVAFVSLASAKRAGSAYAHAKLELSPICLVMPVRHRLAKLKSIHLKDLRGEQLLSLLRDDEPDVRQRLDSRLASLGTVQTAIELSHPQALLPLIAAGLGVAIMPAFLTRDSGLKLRVVPIAELSRGGIMAVWNKRQVSETTRRFLELLSSDVASARR